MSTGKKIPLCVASNWENFQEFLYSETVEKVGGPAAQYLMVRGTGKFFQFTDPLLYSITEGLLAKIFNSGDAALEASIEVANFDADMFDVWQNLVVVSAAKFNIEYVMLLDEYKRIRKENDNLKSKKPECWNILQSHLPLKVLNQVKSKEEYEAKFRSHDVEWLLKSTKSVVLMEQCGIRSEDYITVLADLLNYKQDDNQSLASYYQSFDQKIKNIVGN